MTRSFDRRGGYPGGSKPAAPPANISSASIRPKKEERINLGIDLDCLCSKNDPDCAECWVLTAQNADPYLGGITATTTSTNPKPVQVEPFSDQFDRDVRYRFDECLELLLRKHKDYGPSNIGNAPGGPLNGLRVRLHDKLARINHLIDTGVEPSNESFRDSWVDGANYFLIGLMVLDGVWPGTEHK